MRLPSGLGNKSGPPCPDLYSQMAAIVSRMPFPLEYGGHKMIQRLLTFDKLIGTTLIKILYYIGLVGIGLYAIIMLLTGLGVMVSQSFLGGIGIVIAAIIGGAISLLFWRFMCELYMLFFRISDDVRELKEMKSGPTPPAASPASSDF
ncbi:MAG TPA: hypothetical protein DCG65_03750 [Hyphomonas atlantica]|uniref:DUF4282 domain-containing protein n=2 Tax=Hyphomonadaceae TaxID=69657 RepID=A0A356W399_9PROT|nr:hypothetical protein [Hyphomonas atlantica]HBH43640.1 hypothetical protein [Hyphomonas atlantica]HBQ48070.1 hypothetical protein [Hyphomonas atlantica]|tara:strand:- start:552 stop:995 length:444 start_codon:yes stop_codon:yes gene_type:complete